MKRAMFMKRINIGAGDALLYGLSDPVEYEDDGATKETNNVVVSAAIGPPFGERATVFPSDEDGNILSWAGIHETKMTLDHEAPLVELGYEIL